MTKAELRGLMRGSLGKMGAGDAAERSELIAARLQRTSFWGNAEAVLSFLSVPGEVDTGPIIRAAVSAGKLVAAPRIEGHAMRFHLLPRARDGLERGGLGILQPAAASPIFDPAMIASKSRGILVVVPGLAFDRLLNRLGRGKGYYDRFLRDARKAAPGRLAAVAVCFSLQLIDAVPFDPADQRVDCIVTEEETVP